jgi:putative aminopeptidase
MRVVAALTAFLLFPDTARADTAARLLELLSISGVSGYEAPVREGIEMLLPIGARVRADNLGNIVIRTGNGLPHTLIVAPLDESGLVVSAITDDGYLRVHRHTTTPSARLATQYVIGQPIQVRTASGAVVAGVTATPSAHLRGMRDPDDEARIKTIDDIWLDVGAESPAEVETLGIRLLDSVTLRERATRLAGARVSGVAAGNRAAALAIAEIIRRSPGKGAMGSVTLAWVTQSEYGQRGMLRLLETLQPSRLIVLGRAPGLADDPRGAVGRLGGGPVIAEEDAFLHAAAKGAQLPVQPITSSRLRLAMPTQWKAVDVHLASVPIAFGQTPVETVDAGDVDQLATLVAAAVGLPPLSPPADDDVRPSAKAVKGAAPSTKEKGLNAFGTLGALIETYGVSAHEEPVRTEIVKRLPAWATPRTDERGNVIVSFGKGGKPLVFVAHMDEVGFDITEITPDGGALVRARGGMYLSVHEAHPMLVHTPKGPISAVLTPRRGYLSAKEAQPDVNSLSLYFGTDTAEETAALGVVVGQSVTVRKKFAPLGTHRATGRAMDDRNGSTALLLALQQIDPDQVANQITFAWSVEEETGLSGATHLASTLKPDTVFAIDTFVSTDTPVDIQRLAGAKLGRGAVLRVLDSRTIVPPHIVDRIVGIARAGKIPLQLGTTSGGTDASVFSAGGAVDVGLSWPGRYSHSPVEIMDRRDLDSLVRLIVALAKSY